MEGFKHHSVETLKAARDCIRVFGRVGTIGFRECKGVWDCQEKWKLTDYGGLLGTQG